MEFNRKYDLARICDTRDHRKMLHHAWLDTKASTLTASDGAMLVRVPVLAFDEDATGWIDAESLNLARKAAKKTAAASVQANGSLIAAGNTRARPTIEDVGTAPEYDRVIPEAKEPHITLDAEKLAAIQKALGSRCVSIQFATLDDGTIDPRCAMRITASDSPDAVAVLMPARR